MKIRTYGVVILTEHAVKVEGWNVEREITDPPETEATTEQLLLEVAVSWAQKKLNEAIMANLKRIAELRKAAAAMKTTAAQKGN